MPTTYTTPGTHVYTAPADGTVDIECIGAGGSGRKDFADSNGGGGGGENRFVTARSVTSGEDLTFVVGAKGVSATATSGGDTTLNGTEIIAKGGLLSNSSIGGGGGGGVGTGNGTGGTGHQGGSGGACSWIGGGGGGGSGSSSAVGTVGETTGPGHGSSGGAGGAGEGNGGRGGDGTTNASLNSGQTAPGSGGGGAGYYSYANGGDGTDGQVTVTFTGSAAATLAPKPLIISQAVRLASTY